MLGGNKLSKNSVKIKILGSAQDAGIPQANCYCENCQRAYENPKIRRLASSLAIVINEEKWHLVDATPDMREQLIIMKREFPHMGLMESILLTHAHAGHYPGLLFLGKEGMSTKGLPVFAGKEMENFLKKNAPWTQLVELRNIQVKPMINNQSFQIDEQVEILPFEVPHRNEFSETFGFIIKGPTKKLLYIPDIDSWNQWEFDICEMAKNVDICIVDATFYSVEEISSMGREITQIPHPLLTETMDRLQEIVNDKKTIVYFTHFNHTNPVVNSNSREIKIVKNRGFDIAVEGMEFIL